MSNSDIETRKEAIRINNFRMSHFYIRFGAKWNTQQQPSTNWIWGAKCTEWLNCKRMRLGYKMYPMIIKIIFVGSNSVNNHDPFPTRTSVSYAHRPTDTYWYINHSYFYIVGRRNSDKKKQQKFSRHTRVYQRMLTI